VLNRGKFPLISTTHVWF